MRQLAQHSIGIPGGCMTNRNRQQHGSPRRPMVWARTIVNETIAAAGVALINLLGDLETEVGAVLQAVTITRTIGHLDFRGPLVSTSNRGIDCFVVLIVKPSAFTTYFPTTSEYLRGTMFYDNAQGQALERETAVDTFSPMALRLIDIDIRSQRKVARVEEEFQLVIQNVSGSNIDVDGFFNVLVKLP